MTPRAGFFKAFFGSCCGRDIFYTLRHHSWVRCLSHLFLLSLITGCIIGNVQSRRFTSLIDASQTAFTALFGQSVWVTPPTGSWNWVCPVKDPHTPREMTLPGGGRLYYTGSSRAIPKSLKEISGAAVVWSPSELGISVPVANGEYNCVIIDRSAARIDRFSGSSSALERVFQRAPDKAALEKILSRDKLRKEEAALLFMTLNFLFSISSVIGTVFWNFFLTLLYTGIFIGMYRLLNGPSGRLRFLTLKEMWKCGIYAAFPAMAVATFFPVLDLPLVSYETVFMIGLLLYWLSVIARLERTPDDNEVNNAN